MTRPFVSPSLADCVVCNGTGRDEAFNSPCNCLANLSRSARVEAARAELGDSYATTADPSTPRSGVGRADANRHANRYPGKCVKCNGWVEAGAGLRTRDGQGWAVQHTLGQCGATCTECGGHVARGQGLARRVDGELLVRHSQCPRAAAPRPTVGLDLSPLPMTGETTYFAVPGGDTRLKVRIDRPADGKWAGFIFVKDGAVYGEGARYGKQAPGQRYVGDIEAELAAILADPFAALRRYAELTNHCGVCNRPLEDAESVARGIGPVCARKLGVL